MYQIGFLSFRIPTRVIVHYHLHLTQSYLLKSLYKRLATKQLLSLPCILNIKYLNIPTPPADYNLLYTTVNERRNPSTEIRHYYTYIEYHTHHLTPYSMFSLPLQFSHLPARSASQSHPTVTHLPLSHHTRENFSKPPSMHPIKDPTRPRHSDYGAYGASQHCKRKSLLFLRYRLHLVS